MGRAPSSRRPPLMALTIAFAVTCLACCTAALWLAAPALGLGCRASAYEPCTVTVGDRHVPYVEDALAEEAPPRTAALWDGSDDVDDGSYGWFVGHNPGVFSPAADLGIGDVVSVCDSDGDYAEYEVADVFEIEYGALKEAVSPRLADVGEAVVVQTCVEDDMLRFAVAKRTG